VNNQRLIYDVLVQLEQDMKNGDFTAIEELLQFVPVQYLEAFLSE
jgi:hypothetical protein